MFRRSFFDSFFNEFFNDEWTFSEKRLLGSTNNEQVDDKETASDYKKEEHEEISKDGKLKRIHVIETWTSKNGVTNRRSYMTTEPNISKEELEKETKLKDLKEKLKNAVSKEDYETAAKLKSEIESVK